MPVCERMLALVGRTPHYSRLFGRRFRLCRGGVAAAVDPQAGFVTAEAAMVMPMLVVVTSLLLWGLMTAAAQIRCVDAARAGARAAARSEPRDMVLAAAATAAPPGASVDLRRNGDLVQVRVTAESLGPGRMARLLSVTVGADAVALAEDTVR